MTASNFEKLVWNYIKTYILGGFFFFFKKELLPLTIYLIATALLLHYQLINFDIVFVQAIILIAAGILASKKKLSAKTSSIIVVLFATSLILIYFNVIPTPTGYTSIQITLEEKYYLTIALLLFWVIFSLSYLIFEIADFFASTAGQFILWGSDRKRIFFTPLPQIALAISVIFPLYQYFYLTFNLMDLAFTLTPGLMVLIIIYGLFRNKGRILRNAFAIYSFLLVYIVIAYASNGNFVQGAVINGFLTIIGVMFMMQGRIRDIAMTTTSEVRAPYVPAATLAVFGTIMIFLGFLTRTQSYTTSIETIWWKINIVGSFLAVIIAVVALYVTGRVKGYTERDKITTKELFLEIGLIIGRKIIDEIVKNYADSFQEVTKKAVEKSEETIEKIRKTIKEAKDFLDKFLKF